MNFIADIDVFRKDLEQRRRELLDGIKASQAEAQAIISASADGHPVDYNHPADMIEGDADFAKFLELGRRQKAELLLVDQAIDRLRTGEYGSCDKCGEDIASARLHAVPYARFCLPCQERADRTAKEAQKNEARERRTNF